MIAIVDYGVGNLFSLRSSVKALGREAELVSDPRALQRAERILLPGVGAFGDAADKLFSSGLGDAVREAAGQGKALMGICLGMQLLFERSLEHGAHEGLGLLEGEVVPMADALRRGLRLPHIGWNALRFPDRKDELFRQVGEGEWVYFVHSFHAAARTEDVIATVEYGSAYTAAVRRGRVCGCQFHPEKSGRTGLNILRAFLEEEA